MLSRMKINRKKITIEFHLTHYQRDEYGNVETLFFVDQVGSVLSIGYNQFEDYNLGIRVVIDEYVYHNLKGKGITLNSCESVESIATNSEIFSKKNKETNRETRNEQTVLPSPEDTLKQDIVEPQPIEPKKEVVILRRLFRKHLIKKSINRFTGQEDTIIKFNDTERNALYITEEQYYGLTSSTDVNDFLIIEISQSDLERDLERTRKMYAENNSANISPESIRYLKVLGPNEFDHSILNEIFNGKWRKDERYNSNDILDLHERIRRWREERNMRREERSQNRDSEPRNENIRNENQPDYGFNVPVITPITTQVSSQPQQESQVPEQVTQNVVQLEKVDGRKAGAQRRWERINRQAHVIEQQAELIKQLRQRIEYLESTKEMSNTEIQQAQIINDLTMRISQLEAQNKEFLRLKRIFNGEDDEFLGIIQPIS